MARPIQDAIVLFGDSITSRQDVAGSLQSRFSEAYRRTMDILNRGFGGYTTRTVLPLVDQILCRKGEEHGYPKVKLMTIWFGANDAAVKDNTGKGLDQNVPLDQYISNLNHILTEITSGEKYPVIPNIILITATPLCLNMMDAESQTKRIPKITKTYVDAVVKIGEEWKAKSKGEWKVATVNSWDAIINDAGGTGDELRPYFTDGLHLASPGYKAVWEQIVKILETDFKGRGIGPDEIKMAVPDIHAIDPQDETTVTKLLYGDHIRR